MRRDYIDEVAVAMGIIVLAVAWVIAMAVLGGCSITTGGGESRLVLAERQTITYPDGRVETILRPSVPGVTQMAGAITSIVTASPWPCVATALSPGVIAIGEGVGRSVGVLDNLTTTAATLNR